MTKFFCVSLLFVLAMASAAPGQTNAPTVGGPTLIVNDVPDDKGLAAAQHVLSLVRDNRKDEALVQAMTDTQTHPEHELAWYALGHVYLTTRRFQEGTAPLLKCVFMDPKNGPALFDLGLCQQGLHDFDASITTLWQAVDRMPDVELVWKSLYGSYGGKNDIQGAETAFRAYTEKHPQSACAWYVLGSVQMYEQLPDEATASWEKAVQIKPDFFNAERSLGITYSHAGKYDQALSCLARAVSLKRDPEIVNDLGYTYMLMGQNGRAIEVLKQSLEIDPKYEKTLYNLTDAYGRQKQWAQAWQTAHVLAQVSPQSAEELTKNFPPENTVAQITEAEAAPTNAVAAMPPPAPATNAPPASSPSSVLTVGPISGQSTLLASPATTNLATVATSPATRDVSSAPATDAAPVSAPSPEAAAATQAPAPAPAPPASPAPAAASSAPAYSIGQPPAWVKPLDPDAVNAPASASNGGLDYILIDNQEMVEPQSNFNHSAVRLANEQGLQLGSDLRAEFDPNYQTLTINWLKVKRDGIWSDRLRNDSFQLIRREVNLDSQMLDGRYSAICHLQDVRVGDIVEFAYTVTGANPVFGGKFVSDFSTGFLQPVGLFSTQITLPPGRDIAVKGFGGAPDPVRAAQPDGSRLLTWRQENVPATVIEPGIPPSYDALPWVELSEFSSWADVAKWGYATFSLDEPLSPELQQAVDDIKAAHTTPETRAMAAINFVQDQVRYLGVEMGANSYKPTPASQVFARRFGDCKDKTQLCVVMLHALGIQCDPALVSTIRGEATNDLLPSPLDFDHAIASLYVDKHLYWADLTRTGQCGELRDLAVDDFKRALPVSLTSTAPARVVLSPASLPQITVDETYKVPSATDPATLLIHAVYHGSAAEAVRDSFSALSHEELQKNYLDYYGREYPQIQVGAALRSQDFPAENRFEVWHTYTVPGFWTRDSASLPYRASFIPFSIIPLIGHTTPVPRTAPYRVDYPADVTVNMELDLFDTWPLEALPARVETPNFAFALFPSVQDNVMHFQYHYQATAPDVPPAGIAQYNDAVERIRDQLEYRLTYTPGISPNGVGALQPDWKAVCILGMAFSISLATCTGIYFIRRYDDEDDYYRRHSPYEGIGGWLVFICIGMAFRAIYASIGLFGDLKVLLYKPKFDLLTHPGSAQYNPYWATTFYFEGCIGVVTLVFLLLATVLLIQKRFTFPLVMIGIIVSGIVFTGIDHALVLQIFPVQAGESPLPPNFLRMLLSAAIWIPYLLVSKRVKATFRH